MMRSNRPTLVACCLAAVLLSGLLANPAASAPAAQPIAAENIDVSLAGATLPSVGGLFLAQAETADESAAEKGAASTEAESSEPAKVILPAWLLVLIGIVSVLGLIIGLKLNAFLALIISALLVSLLSGVDPGAAISGVGKAFGSSAGSIGIVIAMAAIIGKCMLDSGSADRIVRSAVGVTGEKKASLGLMVSGFVLAIPVFFDTVFYLLVPLARSLHRRTNKHYLRYLMAIATGGAITHTLVPPTPGPLLVAAILGVDIGTMIMIGAAVAIPTAILGLIFSVIVDAKMPVPMRELGAGAEKHKPLDESKLPSLWVSLLPIVLPVLLIGAGTLASTLADREDRAKLASGDIQDFDALAETLSAAQPGSPAGQVVGSETLSDADVATLKTAATTDEEKSQVVALLNGVLLDADFYDETAFLGIKLSDVVKGKLSADQVRMKPVDRRRMNRALLEDSYPEIVAAHQWDSPARKLSNSLSLWSNANFALLLAALCAMLTMKLIRKLSWSGLGNEVEEALMSGGIIILITAAGGAFGAALQGTDISNEIKDMFKGQAAQGITVLLLGWAIAAVLKVAQGSSTVAMIVGAGMISAIIGGAKPEYNMVYVATAVGAGSLMGSWMNDSGFWVFTKMGGLTEGESLRSWTPLLAVLSIGALITTIILSLVMPMA